MPDLSTLNPAEREVLALLAQGHTAKSIASLTGRSIGSINERLREARRKTGVGSSRELARLFAAQQNRDEQIGVAPAHRAGEALPLEAAPRRAGGKRKALLVMIPIAIAAVAALTLSLQDAPKAAPDPLLDGVIGNRDTTAPRLHERVRTETRDPAWAPTAEALLRARYATIAGVDRGNAFRVMCAATLCEVTGTITPRGSDGVNATMQMLQGTDLHSELRDQGFADALMHGFGGEAGARQTRFVSYWRRKD